MGIDVGEAAEPVAEELPAEAAPAEPAGDAFELLSAPRGAPDDLTNLAGVGPQVEKKLNEGGIWHYWQLAAMTPADVAKVDADLKLNGRIERDNWVELARTLVAGA
jgi:small subunit ribosomal protein S2